MPLNVQMPTDIAGCHCLIRELVTTVQQRDRQLAAADHHASNNCSAACFGPRLRSVTTPASQISSINVTPPPEPPPPTKAEEAGTAHTACAKEKRVMVADHWQRIFGGQLQEHDPDGSGRSFCHALLPQAACIADR